MSDVFSWPRLAMLLLVGLSAAASARPNNDAGSRDRAEARAAVRAVLGAFRRAIVAKSEADFLTLFNAGPVVWQSVDSASAQMATGALNREPAFRDPDKTPQSFIRGIVANRARIDESMANIRIQTDGDVASVTFDFVYSRDGEPANVGLEAWHLVRTHGGWRIVSVVWSNHPPASR